MRGVAKLRTQGYIVTYQDTLLLEYTGVEKQGGWVAWEECNLSYRPCILQYSVPYPRLVPASSSHRSHLTPGSGIPPFFQTSAPCGTAPGENRVVIHVYITGAVPNHISSQKYCRTGGISSGGLLHASL